MMAVRAHAHCGETDESATASAYVTSNPWVGGSIEGA